MKRNLIHIIYPAEKTISFVHESDNSCEDILEEMFAMFNNGSGVESDLFISSKCRSLSVNDIVCVNGKYHQCQSFGWQEVSTEFVNKLEKEVTNHPDFVHGPWFALISVMFEKNKDNEPVFA